MNPSPGTDPGDGFFIVTGQSYRLIRSPWPAYILHAFERRGCHIILIAILAVGVAIGIIS